MDNQLIYYVVTFLAGAAFTSVSYLQINKRNKLLKNGIRTDGVVFSIQTDARGSQNDNVTFQPVIRFLTKEKVWITEKYNISTGYTTAYKEGDKVVVIYDRDDNTKFIINDTSTKLIGPLFLIIGIALIAASIVCYLFKIQIHHS